MEEQHPDIEDDSTDDHPSPASTVDGSSVANVGEPSPGGSPPEASGMENVQQLPGEGTLNIDIEPPPDIDRNGC